MGEPRPACPCCQCHGMGTSCQQRILWRAVTHALHSSLAARPCRIRPGQARTGTPHHSPLSSQPVVRGPPREGIFRVQIRGPASVAPVVCAVRARAARASSTHPHPDWHETSRIPEPRGRVSWAGFTYGPILFVCILKRDPGPGRVLQNALRLWIPLLYVSSSPLEIKTGMPLLTGI